VARRLFTVILASALLSSPVQAADSSARKEADADQGRFQLFQGTYSTFDLRRSETYTSTSVFLIDTKTGQVKRYVNKIDSDGRYIEEWVPTSRVQEKR
jgi:hypothetical protein